MAKTINEAIESVPIGLVKPHPRNVNQGDFGAIQQSIETNGFFGTIVANKRTGHILAGNHRWHVAKSLHFDTVPVAWVDVDDEQEIRILIADNRTTRLGIDDEAGLTALLAELANTPTGLTGTGFDGEDLDRLIADLAGPTELLGDPDEVPEPPVDPITKPGDLWLLGDHRLLCGDSTKAEDVARLMAGRTVQTVFTDPPYGIDYTDVKGRFDRIQNDATDPTSLISRSLSLLPSESVYLCCNWRCLTAMTYAMKENGIEPKATIVWDKGSRIQNLDRYAKRHELIVYAGPYGGMPTLADDVWVLKRETRDDHPTAKPIALCAQAIEHSSHNGDVIADPFLGSGTTLIAAEQLGRKCYGMEISPQYCDVIVKRWETLTGKTARLEAQDGTTE